MARIVTDYLDKTAELFPEKVFVGDKDKEITYKEFKEKALKIASHINACGYSKQPVAVYMKKSVECLIAIFGIIYSGCFYTVIDAKGSIDRNKRIIEDLEPVLIITDDLNIDNVKKMSGSANVMIYKDGVNDSEIVNMTRLERIKVLRSDILCVIYTSGSTGTPKGVAIPHKSVVNYIEDATLDYQNFSSEDIFGNQYPFYYVASLDDIFLTLRNGATLHIIPEELFYAPSRLVDWLINKHISVINWVPSAMELISQYDALSGKSVSEIKKVIFGGEVIKAKVLRYWMSALPKADFINGYGATETTEGTTYYIVDHIPEESDSIPLGKPLRGVELIVLDDNNNRVKNGQQGELYVRTDYLSYGYYKDFEKTIEVFVQNPLNKKYHEVVYKTGDIVEVDDQGNLIFIGRKDSQIKKNGHRINLAEIEETLNRVCGVEQCACLYQSEQKCIAALYTGTLAENEVQKLLTELLPTAMRPDMVKRVEYMPLNANGKIDRTTLARGITV